MKSCNIGLRALTNALIAHADQLNRCWNKARVADYTPYFYEDG